MLVAHGLLQNRPYRAAHVLKAPAGALQAFYRRAVQGRYAEVEHSGAHAGQSTQHCQCRCGIWLPSPTLPFTDAPSQCSLFEMFRLSAALGLGVG
jgi:hypothetical protein